MSERQEGREIPLSSYDLLKKNESQEADRNEAIFIVGLKKSSPEFSRLQAAGVDPVALEEGRITRGELLDAGYVFLNRLGAGEKPILNAVIPLGESRDEQLLDVGSRALLNQEELDAVINYQQQRAEEFGTNGIETEELRRDMLVFLEESVREARDIRNKLLAAFSAVQRKILSDPKYLQDIPILKDFFGELFKDRQAGNQELYFIINECLLGVDLVFARGIPIDAPSFRLGKLSGAPSPFLDSGFHFAVNYDVTLYPYDKEKTRRLNMPVIHLLSRGLNEMGGSLNDSHDQQYITSGQYAQEIFPKKSTSENLSQSPISEETLGLVADRLLYKARAYLKMLDKN
ncbi:MAG: hypothetical protein V1716_02800 [Candidatus Uhrbacteria bacterium]